MEMKRWMGLSLVAVCVLGASEVETLEEVVVVGTRTESTLSALPMQVSVITSEEIENSGAVNLADILSEAHGLHVKQTGGNGPTLSIRGMAVSDTLFLIDGKRVNGEPSKTYELDRISAGMIERIEIVKGSASLLYGSDAMGGVVNIITKKPSAGAGGSVQLTHGAKQNSADAFVYANHEETAFRLYSSYLDRKAFRKDHVTEVKVMQSGAETTPSALIGGGNWALLRNALSDSYAISRDYQDALELKSVGAGVMHAFTDNLWADVEVRYLKEDKEGRSVANRYATAYTQGGNKVMAAYIPTHQFDDNKRLEANLGVGYAPLENWELEYTLAYSKYEKERRIYTDLWQELGYSSKEASLSSFNESTLKKLNHDILSTYTIAPNNRVLGGAEYKTSDTTSTAYAKKRNSKAVFLQHEYGLLEGLNLVYGVRYDKDSIGEDATSVSVGASYALSEAVVLKANYAQGFRSPDDRELYVDQTNPQGRKMLGSTVIDATVGKTTAWELKPETSETYEAGVLVKGGMWSAEATVFHTSIKDRITQVQPTTAYNTFENVDKSEIKGVEGSVSLRFSPTFKTRLSYTALDAKNKTDNTKLTSTPESLATLTLSYFPLPKLELRSTTQYTGKQTLSDTETVGGFGVTGVRVVYTGAAKGLDVFAGVHNLFGKTIPEGLGVIQKHQYYAGVQYKF